MMILESKNIPFEAIDITEPGKEKEKDFMLANAKPRGDSKIILSPQIFNDDRYCGVSFIVVNGKIVRAKRLLYNISVNTMLFHRITTTLT